MRKLRFCCALIFLPAIMSAAAAQPVTPAPPIVAYVHFTKQALLVNNTASSVAFAGGTLLKISKNGKEIVRDLGIEDSATDMARSIAVAFAAAHGGQVSETAIDDNHRLTHPSPRELSARSNGARYVVNVSSPGMQLWYFPFDIKHFDMIFMSDVQIIDTADQRVIAKTHCLANREHSPDAPTQAELLADGGARLKQLIASKSQTCVAQMEANLGLTAASAVHAETPSRPDATPGAGKVAKDAPTCDADKMRYAAQVGVPCSSLGDQVSMPATPATR